MAGPFRLEAAVAAWRRSFTTSRTFTEDDADELEAHLRDHVRHRRADGLSAEAAFREAVVELGGAIEAAPEYQKLYWSKAAHERRLMSEIKWRFVLLKTDVVIAVRHARRRGAHVALNILGLALGLAACLLMGLFVRDELSFDRQHRYADRIVRTGVTMSSPRQPDRTIQIDLPSSLDEDLLASRPDIEALVRVTNPKPMLVRRGGFWREEPGYIQASAPFFEFFDFEIERGDPADLARPGVIFITEELATRQFGNDNPLGQTLVTENDTLEVVGILAPPERSHLNFQAVASFVEPDGSIMSVGTPAYLLLSESSDPDRDREALEAFLLERVAEEYGENTQIEAVALAPLTGLYLREGEGVVRGWAWGQSQLLSGKPEYVWAFGMAALLVLLVACVNFVNLATARARERAAEVGVRKAVGAQRLQLVRQFLVEAGLQTTVALLLAGGLAAVLLPQLNAITGKRLRMDLLGDPMLLVLFVGVGVVVTLLVGLYPALYLAAYRPVAVLRRLPRRAQGAVWVRRSLVAFQFAVSAGLLLSTLAMHNQLDYLQQRDLGLEASQVMQLGTTPYAIYPAFKQELQGLPGIEQVSVAPRMPHGGGLVIAMGSDAELRPEDELHYFDTDADLEQTLGLQLVAGRFLDESRPADQEAVVLNEAAVQTMGWTVDTAVGRTITPTATFGREPMPREVVGVVADAHMGSLREAIEPMYFQLRMEPAHPVFDNGRTLVRVDPERLPETLTALEGLHAEYHTKSAFTYTFLDEAFASRFETERRLRTLASAFAALALAIAALGVIGLVAHTAQRRTKEIGIRKVLGATEQQIVALLSREMLVLVLLGFAAAAPLVYLGMQRWLDGFAYRITLGPGLFVTAAVAVLSVALMAAGTLAWRAARLDPSRSLRYE